MSPLREAVILPAVFLTVALLGGLRVTDHIRLVPPSLTALVLAFLLLGTLIQGRVFAPSALLHAARLPMENLSGLIVFFSLFAASAQAINLLIPEHGLLHAASAIFLFCQILTMTAAGSDRLGTLRGLLVLVGSLFVIRFILLEALFTPDGGLLHRVLVTVMSGVSLGGIAYEPHAAITGYVAFFTLLLYLGGIFLLPAREPVTDMTRRPLDRPALTPLVALLVAVPLASAACRGGKPGDAGSAQSGKASKASTGLVSPEQRADALRRAQIWRAPAVPIGQADLKQNPGGTGAFRDSDEVECRLVIKGMGGTTPKFDCELPGADVVRVKYGRGNPELHSEVASTRLLAALGFGADRIFVVRKVRCAGCTSLPFQSLRCLQETGIERGCFPAGINYSRAEDFHHAVVERRMDGRRIESREDEGWAWFELDRIDHARGGASPAHVDGFRLLAMLLAHWDNKAENQRLVCLPGGDLPDGGCSQPLAILQDLGASFGPSKLDLQNWRSTPVWADAAACRVSMKHLPWGGGTFPDRQISEDGRLFLLGLLGQLSQAQVQDLFAGARVELSEGILAEGKQPAAWAATFQDKVRQIREGGPCPAAASAPASRGATSRGAK